MLKEAEKRFEGNDNISFICDDYITHEFNTKFDIIISSLSIHHLTGTEKKVLIEKYYDLLNDGGNFVNADQVLNPNKCVEDYFKSKLDEHTGEISEKAYGEAKIRRTYDKPSSVDFQLECLKMQVLTVLEFLINIMFLQYFGLKMINLIIYKNHNY